MKFKGVCSLSTTSANANRGLGAVRITSDWIDTISQWDSRSRISPIFAVDDLGNYNFESPAESVFPNHTWIVFFGPVHPSILKEWAIEPKYVWATLGLLNMIVAFDAESKANVLLSSLDEEGISWEIWKIENGIIIDERHCATIASENFRLLSEYIESLAQKSEEIKTNGNAEIVDLLSEFCFTVLSLGSRARFLPQRIEAEILEMCTCLCKVVEDEVSEIENDPNNALKFFLDINAGLSRFSSQTFSGIPPVLQTESHLWSHSMLGIGIPGLGLKVLTDFVYKNLDKAKLEERIDSLRNVTEGYPDLCACLNDTATKLKHRDFLFANGLPEQRDDDANGLPEQRDDDANGLPEQRDDDANGLPEQRDDDFDVRAILAYFSGRDGYHATEQMVSAPLITVAASNDPRWSLLTITHEISHLVMRRVQSVLLMPRDEIVDWCSDTLDYSAPAANLLDEMRRALIVSICNIQQTSEGDLDCHRKDVQANDFVLQIITRDWWPYVDEMLSSVFDFFYFYGKDAQYYTRSAWITWSVIPNLNQRIREYVVRTICVVAANHIHRAGSADIAMRIVLAELEKLKEESGNKHFADAVRIIKTEWESSLKRHVKDRLPLVGIIPVIIYSDQISRIFREEKFFEPTSASNMGYGLTAGVIDENCISNPLLFVQAYSNEKSPSLLRSAWMYYVLTFCLVEDGGESG